MCNHLAKTKAQIAGTPTASPQSTQRVTPGKLSPLGSWQSTASFALITRQTSCTKEIATRVLCHAWRTAVQSLQLWCPYAQHNIVTCKVTCVRSACVKGLPNTEVMHDDQSGSHLPPKPGGNTDLTSSTLPLHQKHQKDPVNNRGGQRPWKAETMDKQVWSTS